MVADDGARLAHPNVGHPRSVTARAIAEKLQELAGRRDRVGGASSFEVDGQVTVWREADVDRMAKRCSYIQGCRQLDMSRRFSP